MLSCDILIHGGTVVVPGAGSTALDVLVTGEQIVGLVTPGTPVKASQRIDATGKHVLPGVIDPHTHWGNYSDFTGDAHAESRAAALGGTTTALLFQRFSAPGAPTGHGRFAMMDFDTTVQAAQASSVIDFSFSPIIFDDASAELVDQLVEDHHCASFKYYLAYKDLPGAAEGDGWNKVTDGQLMESFNRLAKHPGTMACVHAENAEIINHAQRDLQQTDADGLPEWESANPGLAEAEAILRASYFAEQAGIRAYIVHLSGREALAAVVRARRDWPQVYAETCTHYLLHESGSSPADIKYSPPVRGQQDREALWAALADGTLQCVASDSVCTPADLKTGGVWDVARGAPGAALVLPAVLTEGVAAGRLSLEQAVRVTSENAAKIFGLYPRKGVIRPGSDADLVVVDLGQRQTVQQALGERGDVYGSYRTHELTGWPVTTMVRGQVVVADGQLQDVTGSSSYVPRGEPTPLA